MLSVRHKCLSFHPLKSLFVFGGWLHAAGCSYWVPLSVVLAVWHESQCFKVWQQWAPCWQTSGCWNPRRRTKSEVCGQAPLVVPLPDSSQRLYKLHCLPSAECMQVFEDSGWKELKSEGILRGNQYILKLVNVRGCNCVRVVFRGIFVSVYY